MDHQKKSACLKLLVVLTAGALVPAMRAAQATASDDLKAAHILNVRDYGVVGDGKTLDTPAIAKAIKACSEAGGGTLVFPPGEYLAGTFELLSNVTLQLEAGAVIRGSKDLADYGSLAEYGFGRIYGVDSSGEGQKVGLIVARNAKNIAIVGRGAIDGSGDDFFDFATPHVAPDFEARYTRQGKDFMHAKFGTDDGPVEIKASGRPGTMIIFANCQNVLVRDVTLRNAPNWTFHLANCEGAVVSGIHIRNNLLIPNNDGIDCVGSRNIRFSDGDIRAGDDDFAIVGSENVTVTNCTLVSRSSAIRLEDTRYSTFQNLVIRSNRGIGIYQRGRDVTENVLFSDIVMETRLHTGHWWGKSEPLYIAASPGKGAGGRIRAVRFSNIIAEGESGILVYGSEETPIQDLAFDRIKLRIKPSPQRISDAVGGNFDLRWTATRLEEAVFKHDIPGVFCRYVEGLKIHGLELEWADNLPDYFSHGIQCENFRNLEIDGFQGRQAPKSGQTAAIALQHGSGVSIRNSQAAEGTATFLSLSDVTDQRLFVNNDLAKARKAMEPAKSSFRLYGNILPAEAKAKPLRERARSQPKR